MKLLINYTTRNSIISLLAVILLLCGLKMSVAYSQPDRITPSAAAQGACLRGMVAASENNWEQAIKYFDEARVGAPAWPNILYNLAFSHHQAGGHELIAIGWYRAYLSTAPDTSDAEQVQSWIVGLEVKIKSRIRKLIMGAKEAYASMDHTSLQDLEARELARALAYLGDFEEAKTMAAGILYGRRSDQHMATAYMTIAREQGRAGDLAGARETFAEVGKVAVRLPDDGGLYKDGDFTYRTYTKRIFYTALYQHQADAGDIAGAKETASLMENASWSWQDDMDRAYFHVAEAQARLGDISGAKETADQLPIYDMVGKSYTYCRIANEQVRMGDISGALESFAQAKEIVGQMEEKRKSFHYSTIVTQQACAGDIAGARETAALITDNKIKEYNTDRDIISTAEHEAGVNGKLGTWVGFVDDLNRNRNQSVNDFKSFVGSLEDKQLEKVAEAISAAAAEIGLFLVNIRENESMWEKYKEPEPVITKLAVFNKTPSIILRSSYRNLSKSEVRSISNIFIREKSYGGFDGYSTIKHSYNLKTINGDKVVMDHTTGLMWHQSGSDTIMSWDKAKDWVKNLNSRVYAGSRDWRLPTVDEAASLLESSKINGLFIDPIFSDMQKYFWTGDECESDEKCHAWSVLFHVGNVGLQQISGSYLPVRPVRSIN